MESVRLLVWVPVFKTALSMERTLLNLNASFAALSRNGFAGAIHISVSHATKSRLQVTTFLERLKKSCLSAKEARVVH